MCANRLLFLTGVSIVAIDQTARTPSQSHLGCACQIAKAVQIGFPADLSNHVGSHPITPRGKQKTSSRSLERVMGMTRTVHRYRPRCAQLATAIGGSSSPHRSGHTSDSTEILSDSQDLRELDRPIPEHYSNVMMILPRARPDSEYSIAPRISSSVNSRSMTDDSVPLCMYSAS